MIREHAGVLLAILDHWRLTAIYLAVATVAAVVIEVLR